MASRYTIGIDLGTTNCALAYVDTEQKPPVSRVLALPQEETPGVWVESATLPSFLYLPTQSGGEKEATGLGARRLSALQPGRVIHSAKSWLCQPSADPADRFLPWGSTEVTPKEKQSPVEVSARLLSELKALWESAMPEAQFDRQDITITVPASFDEAAQIATLQAAEAAGYPHRVRLLEEPQAAFYAYLEGREISSLVDTLPVLAERPATVLVCDIGGGTTDFSLFSIQPPTGRQRIPRIDRIAVSDHLLLGGDNIDLALARLGETKSGRKLTPRQWNQLVALARGLKERVLAEAGAEDEVFHLSLAGGGASLMQATLSLSFTRAEIIGTVRDGFFPLVDKNERPRAAETGLREWGLPFPADSAVTRHLAAFLRGRAVDAVLFNGGTLQPAFLQDRLVEQLTRWNDSTPVKLDNAQMDLAVARGAASYGAVLRRSAGRIRGGYPHALYLEVSRESRFEPASLVCVLPKGFEAGDKLKIDQLRFQLLVNEPVQFQLYYSNVREDEAGTVMKHGTEFQQLPPLQTKLTLPSEIAKPANGRLDIRLEISLSETGLLQVACVTTDANRQRWQLDFNLRKTSQGATEPETLESESIGVPEDRLRRAREKIDLFYGKKKVGELKDSPKVLKHELEKILGQGRDDWNLALLRSLWTSFEPGITRRVRSEAHEVTWLYFAGFCLRPGYGSELDRFRIGELWRCFAQGPAFSKAAANGNQWWILWRRVAGGLDAEQQSAVYAKIVGYLRAKPEPNPEMVLLAGALERLQPAQKAELGGLLLRRVADRKTVALDAYLWALGRVANRIPLYAGDQAALDPKTVAEWLERTLSLELPAKNRGNLALFFSQAATLTGDRARDIDEELRARVLKILRGLDASDEQLRRLQQVAVADRSAQARLFGETLPPGIKLIGAAA